MSMMLPFGWTLNAGYSPPLQRRARSASAIARSLKSGCAIKENAAKPQKRRRRARTPSAIARSRNSGQLAWPSKACRTDPPVRDKPERIHFFDVADTPPLRGGECAAPKTLSKKLKVAALLHSAAGPQPKNSPQRHREK